MQNKALRIFVSVVCLLYIALFVYAGLSKALEFTNFQAQLGQSPLISAYTEIVSYAVLFLELILAILLSHPRTRHWGLYGSFILMTVFSCYIFLILNYSTYIPCSCGGVLEKMSWRTHLFFNSAFCVLAVLALVAENLLRKARSLLKLALILLSGGVAAIAFMLLLFAGSEDIMARENPFIRHYRQALVREGTRRDLNNYSYYFAGHHNSKIYLGNSKAPLYLIAYDTLLQKKDTIRISLDREDLPFRTLSVRLSGSYFYVFDGTVPVVLKGSIKDWKAKVIMNENHYFSRAEIIGTDSIVFTSRDRQSKENVLGRFTFNPSIKTSFSKAILQRQIDGIFDTDGIIIPGGKNGRFTYLYSYRNQYTLVDSAMQVLVRGTTIDTTSRAQIKPVRVGDGRQYKLASQPYRVNLGAAVYDDMLFVHSAARGRFEDVAMWRTSSVIDIYDIKRQHYIASFYIPNSGSDKISQFFIVGNHLYVIAGRQLVDYKLNLTFLNQLKKPLKNNTTGR